MSARSTGVGGGQAGRHQHMGEGVPLVSTTGSQRVGVWGLLLVRGARRRVARHLAPLPHARHEIGEEEHARGQRAENSLPVYSSVQRQSEMLPGSALFQSGKTSFVCWAGMPAPMSGLWPPIARSAASIATGTVT